MSLVSPMQTYPRFRLYEGEAFRGRAFATARALDNFTLTGLNDRVSSLIVDCGCWEICEDTRFSGRDQDIAAAGSAVAGAAVGSGIGCGAGSDNQREPARRTSSISGTYLAGTTVTSSRRIPPSRTLPLTAPSPRMRRRQSSRSAGGSGAQRACWLVSSAG